MDQMFSVDVDAKQEYLDTKPTETAKSEAFVLRSADEYEELVDKSIYNMDYSELSEMIASQFKNTSISSIAKNVSILKTYIDFCISKNLVVHGENRLATFTAKDAKGFVSKQAIKNKYITKEQLREYQNVLYNEQDKLLLELPFIGVRGRTVKEGTYEEIINLTIDDIDDKNNMIILTQNNGKQRIIEVEPSTIELIKDVYEQEFYIGNNGELTDNPRFPEPRRIIINKVEHFIFRIPSANKFNIFTPNLLNSRMRRIQEYVGNPYITFTSVYMSGMLSMAKDIYKDKNEIQKEDFIRICNRFDYNSKYWTKLRGLFNQYRELIK